MRAGFFLLGLTPFLPGVLLPPDVTYPDQSIATDVGNLRVNNTVIPIKDTRDILHQISVLLEGDNPSPENCRPVAKYLNISFSGEEVSPKVFKLWNADDDRPNQGNQIGLVTANYAAPNASDITLNIGVAGSQGCPTDFDKNVKVTLRKKMRRWWPWNIVADLIYSV